MRLVAFVLALLLVSCASGPAHPPPPQITSVTLSDGKGSPHGRSDDAQPHTVLSEISSDPGYGYTKENPIKVGGVRMGPARERAYLSGLTGPRGEPVSFQRRGSCCHFESPNGIMGAGLLDVFLVTYEGQVSPATLYLNMYDEAPLFVPLGFAARSR